MTVLLPLPVVVTRYKCPACARTHSSKTLATKHMARCWYNPEARGCKTCKHYEPAEEDDEFCDEGVSLEASTECPTCHDFTPAVECETCGGSGGTDGPVRKAGPITNCDKWEQA